MRLAHSFPLFFAAASFVVMQGAGCGSGDSFSDGTGGTSGDTGAGGTGAGTGGTAGTSAGTGGKGTTGGAAGTGGSAGGGVAHGGAAGTVGTGGMGGKTGVGGMSGSSGQGGATPGMGGSPGGSAGTTGGTAGVGGTTGGSGGDGGSGGSNACVDGAKIDPAGALFVSFDGDDMKGTGTPEKPLRSLVAALAKADAANHHIYLAPGSYDELAINIPDVAGLVIEGGVTKNGGNWTHDCSSTGDSSAGITSSKAVSNEPVLLADSLTHEAILRRVYVYTRAQGADGGMDQPGETVIGIIVRGAGTKLTLDNVHVTAGKGGNAGPASPGTAGGTKMCNGLTDCSTGMPGSEGKDGAPAQAGTWSEMGYTPGDGEAGTDGGDGENGMMGGAGQEDVCLTGCKGNTQATCALGPTSGTEHAANGTCGCGATHTAHPSPGRGGGASLSVLVGAGAKAVFVADSATSDLGGAAAGAGAIQPENSPTDGAKGPDGPACIELVAGAQCVWSGPQATCTPTSPNFPTLAGGEAGGNGGPAGKTGKSGGGSGGPSFVIITLGSGSAVVDASTTLSPGLGGKGADGAPDGGSADIKMF